MSNTLCVTVVCMVKVDEVFEMPVTVPLMKIVTLGCTISLESPFCGVPLTLKCMASIDTLGLVRRTQAEL